MTSRHLEDACLEQNRMLRDVAKAIVPYVGTVFYTLAVVREFIDEVNESRAMCLSVQTRIEFLFERLKVMQKENSLPPRFKLDEFTDILARFYALVKKHKEKNLALRIATASSLIRKLRAIHEDIDHMFNVLNLDHIANMMTWQTQWEQQSQVMVKQLTEIASNGQEIRKDIAEMRNSMLALTVLVREMQRPNGEKMPAYLSALYDEMIKERNGAPAVKVPPWFFTFDDIDYDPQPFKTSQSGSMGTVHFGTWGYHTRVIIKCMDLTKGGTVTPSAEWKEADVWYSLNHPNVLRMYGACHVSQPSFLVCEMARHGNLKDYIGECKENRRQLWRLLYEASCGLVHLREKNVVHGNLKCSNILVGDDGHAKISDFGFSFVKTAMESGINHQVPTTNEAVALAAAIRVQAPEVVSEVEQNDTVTSSFEADVYSFAVCIMELISEDPAWRAQQFWLKNMETIPQPKDVSNDAWELVQGMGCHDPKERLTIHQVMKRLRRLAKEEENLQTDGDDASIHKEVESNRTLVSIDEVEQRRKERDNDRATLLLQRELEDLRQKIREEERQLERVLHERRKVEMSIASGNSQTSEALKRIGDINANLPTKQLIRILRWGASEEQTQAMRVLASNPEQHSVLEIVRSNGLETIIACMKHGHSSEFRCLAIDVLHFITLSSEGLYLDAVLEHGTTQILMGDLHYRIIPSEQRRAAQYLLVLSVLSARARSFFLQNRGFDLVIKLLWHARLPLYDDHFLSICDEGLSEEVFRFITAHSDSRALDGEKALRAGETEVAIQRLTEAILLDPRNGKLFARRSEAYAMKQQFDLAAKDAMHCMKRLPEYGEGYYRHALALQGLNRPEQAVKAIKQGRQQDPYFFTKDRLTRLGLTSPATVTSSRDSASFQRDSSIVY